MLKAGMLSAAQHLGLHSNEVDALNVFPVPDGDTGTNMTMTVSAAARELALVSDESGFDEAAERIASAMLRGARGNSGVILSLIFRGIAKSVKGMRSVGGSELAQALALGSEAAYKAVMKPTEGTILTVVRQAAQHAAESAQERAPDAIAVWNAALHGAREALAQTPSMLPVLQQAGVVDAGGQGLVYVMEGLLQGFLGKGGAVMTKELPVILEEPHQRSAAASSELDIQFAYCTEFLVERSAKAERSDAETLRQSLMQLGDCVVVVDDDEVIKGHVHTNSPGTVLSLAQAYGAFAQVKVENMKLQHKEAAWAAANTETQENESAERQAPPQVAQAAYGIVAVANGEGVTALLGEIGVDEVVAGGQSMNPSTEDLLRAVNRCPAAHVFILPNNKNIIMTAEQVAPLTERGVSVLQTRSVVQGIGAVLAFDENAGVEANHVQMQRAAERVQTGLVTYAARDSSVENLEIRKGAVIGLENGKLTQTDSDPVRVAERVARHLVRRHGGSIITIYSGEGITEQQTEQLTKALEHRYNDGSVEIAAIPGGQPLYYFMIAVE
jgi:DAK2 domain fusion protein YloV